MRGRILVVAAHADDEALGCGGTIAKYSDNGFEVAVLVMTDGVGAREEAGAAEAEVRSAAMQKAGEILGVSTIRRLSLPDNEMDSLPLLSVARKLEEFVEEWGAPDLVLTHHPGDLNVDHEVVHRAVLTCFRPQPGPLQELEIRTFEVLSSTHWFGPSARESFQPCIFEGIEDQLERKMAALEAYQLEMRPWPHARSLESVRHLAACRGAVVGLPAAEAFGLERRVINEL